MKNDQIVLWKTQGTNTILGICIFRMFKAVIHRYSENQNLKHFQKTAWGASNRSQLLVYSNVANCNLKHTQQHFFLNIPKTFSGDNSICLKHYFCCQWHISNLQGQITY